MAVNIESVSISDATGYFQKFESYIQKKSILKIQVNATSTNGTIEQSDYRISVNGNVYYGNIVTTEILKLAGTNTIVIQVSDSRGATATTTRTIKVTAYNAPIINTASAIRCNADGTPNKTGTYAKVTIDATCTNISGNTYAYKVLYKKKKDTEYMVASFNGTSAIINESKIISGIDVNSGYDFIFEAQDILALSAKIKSLSSKFIIMSVLSNALGVAFGKKAEYENTFEIGYNRTILSKNVFMGSDAINSEEKKIRFNTSSTATNSHDVYMYGGNGESEVAVGVYDAKNNLRAWSYNDVTKELYTGASSFNINGTKVLDYCTDSGWQTLTLSSNFATFSSSTVPSYRKVGKIVELCGAIKSTATIAGSTTLYEIGTLPSGYRPTKNQVAVLCDSNQTGAWLLTISTNGAVSFSRHRIGDALASVTTDVRLSFQATFTV